MMFTEDTTLIGDDTTLPTLLGLPSRSGDTEFVMVSTGVGEEGEKKGESSPVGRRGRSGAGGLTGDPVSVGEDTGFLFRQLGGSYTAGCRSRDSGSLCFPLHGGEGKLGLCSSAGLGLGLGSGTSLASFRICSAAAAVWGAFSMTIVFPSGPMMKSRATGLTGPRVEVGAEVGAEAGMGESSSSGSSWKGQRILCGLLRGDCGLALSLDDRKLRRRLLPLALRATETGVEGRASLPELRGL